VFGHLVELWFYPLTWRLVQATQRTTPSEQTVILLNGEDTAAVLHPSSFSSLLVLQVDEGS
jgi:hypothetical protein